ncbi:MAG: hypothetical protein HW403_595 [Dehalococcoidia bacterium]|nr:hypothetical protein [Dehalococcoidia bacterium]
MTDRVKNVTVVEFRVMGPQITQVLVQAEYPT